MSRSYYPIKNIEVVCNKTGNPVRINADNGDEKGTC